MILTILKGGIATGKTRLAMTFLKDSIYDTIVIHNYSIAAMKQNNICNYKNIIIDECKDNEVINYLKEKASSVYQITCERIK